MGTANLHRRGIFRRAKIIASAQRVALVTSLLLSGVATNLAAAPDDQSSSATSRRVDKSLSANTTPIAIIIDDIGYSRVQGSLAAALPGPVTLAILPHSPHGARLAEAGHQAGKEIMLHAPMSNLQGKPLDEGALTSDMDRLAFVATLGASLQSVPHVKGLNNHMGSLLTQDVKAMQWLMAELKARELYFVDSRTSAATRAGETARRYGLANAERDFFLDNEQDEAKIRSQLKRFIAMAKRRGQGIAIGHPYPATLKVLTEALPQFSAQGLRLVPVSTLLKSTPVNTTPPRFRKFDFGGNPVERMSPRVARKIE